MSITQEDDNPTTSPQTAIKSYEVYRPGSIQRKNLEIRHNGSTIWMTSKERHGLHMPQIDVSEPHGDIRASVKLQGTSRNCLLNLGKPEESDKASWTVLDASGWTASSYSFPLNGATYKWERTHDKELGASRWGQKDFKLVDESQDGQVLAVWVNCLQWLKDGIIARIDYFADIGQELELMSLAAILGIEQRLETNQKGAQVGIFAGATAGGT